MKRLFAVLALAVFALGLAACGASPQAVETAIAQTQAVEQTLAEQQAQTQTAGAPTATFTASPTNTSTNTPVPSNTPTETPIPTDTHTPVPSDTPEPTDTATPAVTSTKTVPPPPSATPTNPPPPPPDFVAIATDVRAQVDSIGGQIDQALRLGFIDCQQLVNSYDYVVNRRNLTLPGNLAGPYATYQAGIDVFIDKVHDIYGNCAGFLADPSKAGGIPAQQWATARTGVNDSRDLITQAIVAAGGTP